MGGKQQKVKVQNRLDPSQVALNNLSLQLAQEQAPYRSQALQGPISGAINPQTQISPQALQGLNLAPSEQAAAGLNYASPYAAAQAGSLLSLTDPSKMTDASMQYFNKIVGPQLLASLTASGLGRSGAIGEATAKAGAQLALPIEQMRESNVSNFANFLGNQQTQSLQTAQGLQTGSPTVSGGGSSTQTTSGGFSGLGALGSGLGLLGAAGGLGSFGTASSLLPFTASPAAMGLGAAGTLGTLPEAGSLAYAGGTAGTGLLGTLGSLGSGIGSVLSSIGSFLAL